MSPSSSSPSLGLSLVFSSPPLLSRLSLPYIYHLHPWHDTPCPVSKWRSVFFFCWLAAALGWLDGSAGLHSHCLRSHLISLAVSLGRRSDPSAEIWVGLGRQQESEKLTANTENARQMRSKSRFNAIYMKTLGENVLEKALKNNRWCLMNLQETSALSEPSLYLKN